jgi:hypothetical protein
MRRIGDEVRKELARFGAPGGLPGLLEAWPEAVGPDVARNAWPARLSRDGTLHVATSSSAWAFELSQLAPDILERLRGHLADGTPRVLRFAPGHVPEAPARQKEDAETAAAVPGSAERTAAAEIARAIGDDELREKLQRAVAASLSRSRSGRPV